MDPRFAEAARSFSTHWCPAVVRRASLSTENSGRGQALSGRGSNESRRWCLSRRRAQAGGRAPPMARGGHRPPARAPVESSRVLWTIEEAGQMSITLRAYNVLFGDALLVSWDEDDGAHHAWVDFGNFHNDANAVFEKVYNDVLARTAGKLDLLVITHRHLDHMEGFYSLRKRFKSGLHDSALWYAHVTASLTMSSKSRSSRWRICAGVHSR